MKASTSANGSRSGAVGFRLGAGWILALLVLTALTLRVAASLTRPMIQYDESAYLRMAENLAAGLRPAEVSGMTATHFTILLPALIAGVSFILGDFVLSGYVVAIFFGALIPIPTYLLGKELVDGRVGLMAAALMAINPLFINTSEFIYTEVVYIFFLLVAVFFGVRMIREGDHRGSLLCGASLGLAYLDNPAACYYLAILNAILLVRALQKRWWRRIAVAALLFIVAFSVFAVPYIFFLHGELGKWTFSGKGAAGPINAASRNLQHASVWDSERELLALNDQGTELLLTEMEADETVANPVAFVINYPKQALKNFGDQVDVLHTSVFAQVAPLWLLPLLGVGLFAYGWNRKQAVSAGYIFLLMMPAILVLAVSAHARFFMPFAPLLMIWVAQGWQKLEAWAGETVELSLDEPLRPRLMRLAPWLIGALVIVPVFAYTISGAVTNATGNSYPVEYRKAGEWLRKDVGTGQRIMGRNASAAYYAGGISVALPYADYDRTTAFARAKDTDYLVISAGDIYSLRPHMVKLLESTEIHPEWTLVHKEEEGTPREVLIFRLNQ
ncbi:MAG: glycosyltransferase family 39 protein [Thermoleophilia bacterium]